VRYSVSIVFVSATSGKFVGQVHSSSVQERYLSRHMFS
jgi:hypothetical protein